LDQLRDFARTLTKSTLKREYQRALFQGFRYERLAESQVNEFQTLMNFGKFTNIGGLVSTTLGLSAGAWADMTASQAAGAINKAAGIVGWTVLAAQVANTAKMGRIAHRWHIFDAGVTTLSDIADVYSDVLRSKWHVSDEEIEEMRAIMRDPDMQWPGRRPKGYGYIVDVKFFEGFAQDLVLRALRQDEDMWLSPQDRFSLNSSVTFQNEVTTEVDGITFDVNLNLPWPTEQVIDPTVGLVGLLTAEMLDSASSQQSDDWIAAIQGRANVMKSVEPPRGSAWTDFANETLIGKMNMTAQAITKAKAQWDRTHAASNGVGRDGGIRDNVHETDDRPDKRDPGRPTPGKPVILDLNGDGISITELSQSNQYYDTAGDGYQHRTAWAGVGDAILAIDADGDGKIDLKKEIVFTEWDPTAKDDLTALRNVFDTNKDGKLDASDARFGDFKLVITKADGTAETVALGDKVASINLLPDATSYKLADGSSVDGKTTFVRSAADGGGTGTAAAVSLVNEAQGYAKDADQTSVVTDGSGTTITNVMLDAAGKVASKTTTWTSTDGKTRDIIFDTNGDGITDRKQHDVTVAGTSPIASIRTITNKNAADVLLDQTVITTYTDGKLVYDRDMSGGGWYSQREERSADSLSITISDLNPNGTVKSSTTTTFSADHQTRTVGVDLDSDGLADNIAKYEITTGGGGSRIETWTDTNRNASLKAKTVRETDADGFEKQLKTDADGDGSYETVVDSAAVVTKDSSGAVTQSVVTQDTHNADASLRSSVRTTMSGDGLHVTTETDADGAGGYELTRSDDTVLNAIETGARLQTIQTKDAGNHLLASTEIWKAADGRRRTIKTDLNGDGHSEIEETISIDIDGKTKDTVRQLDSAGNLLSRSVTTSSDDGLETTTQTDQAGTGTGFDHTRYTKTTILGSGASEILQITSDSLGHAITSTKTEISADGLEITASENLDADSAYDRVTTDVTTVTGSATGSATYLTRIVEARSESGQLLSRSKTETSRDRLHVTVTADANGDGFVDSVSASDIAANGEVTTVATLKTESGAKISETTTKTSANGLLVTTEENLDGDLDIDRKTVSETKIGSDGHRVQTVTVSNQDLSTRSKTITDASDDGLTVIVQSDLDGDTDFDLTSTSVTKLLSTGETEKTVTLTNQNGSKRSESVSTVSDDGLKVTTTQDFNGDGVIDATTENATTLNADGSRTQVVTRTDLHGVLDQISTTTQFDGRFQDIVRQGTGAVPYYETESHSVEADGDIVSDLKRYDSAHPGDPAHLLNETKTTTKGNGLKTTVSTDIDGNGSFDFSATQQTILGSDGGTTVVKSREIAGGALIDKTSVTTSGNGLTVTTRTDSDGVRGDDMTRTDTKVLNADGSETLSSITFAADGAEISRQTTITDADKDHAIVTTHAGGLKATVEDVSVGADGKTVDQIETWNVRGAKIGTQISTTTANGLQKTHENKDADGKTVDLQTQTTVLNADGSTTETIVETTGTGFVLANSVRVVSDDGLKVDADMSINNWGSARLKTSDVTTLNADGSKLHTTVGTKGDGTLLYSGQQTTSDDGLVVATKLSLDNDANYEVVSTSTTATDGAKTSEKTFRGKTGTLLRTERQITSADGRDTSILIDRDGDGTVDWAEVRIQNQDGSTTSRVKGNTAFIAPAFATVTNVKTNAAGGTTTVIVDSDAADVVDSITTIVESANKLSTSTSFDVDGDGIADLTDLTRSSKVDILNDGSVSVRETTRYGNGLIAANIVTERSSDGRTTKQYIDNDANGIFERSTVVIEEADGSASSVTTDINNKTGKFDNSSSTTVSADGLITRTTSKTPGAEISYTDLVVRFAGTNGSYQWARSATNTPIATSTHMIDANGIDTWSWSITDTTKWNQSAGANLMTASGQIVIDSETKQRYLDAAESIYEATLDREMSGADIEMLAQFITNGSLNRTALANSIITGNEFVSMHGASLGWAAYINFAFMNMFGRLPTAAESTKFSAMSSANAVAAIAELARVSGQSVRSDNHDGVAFGTVSLADATAGQTVDLADATTYYNITKVIGSDFADKMSSDAKASATFIGGKGADLFYGYAANDTVSYLGSDKAVTIDLSLPTQVSTGTEANGDYYYQIENVTGSAFNDTLKGNSGNNILEGGAGADVINGSTGTDTASYANAGQGGVVDLNLTVQASAGTDADGDQLTGIENLAGSAFDDTLIGNGSANTLEGGLGNDLLVGGAGADKFIGGLGTDTVSYQGSTSGIVADMSYYSLTGLNVNGGAGQFGDATGDTYDGIENLVGSSYNDVLAGTDEGNRLDGGASEIDSRGNDQLIGGAGNDVYVFGAGYGRDEIIDHDKGVMTISYVDVQRTLAGSYSYGWTYVHDNGKGTNIQERSATVATSMSVSDYSIRWTEQASGDGGSDAILMGENTLGADIKLADLAFELRGNDLFVGLKTTAGGATRASEMRDAIRIANWTDAKDRVEFIRFADGTSVVIADQLSGPIDPVAFAAKTGSAASDTLHGMSAAEKITGLAGNDSLWGAGGIDRLEGGAGNDSYAFGRGDGWDSIRDEYLTTITEQINSDPYDPKYYHQAYNYTYDQGDNGMGSGTAVVKYTDTGPRITIATRTVENDAGKDILYFGSDIAIDDLAMRLAGNDLVIAIRDTATPGADFWGLKDQIRIENWVDTRDRIETIAFANGAYIDISQLLTVTSGNKQDDVISGSAGDDIISGDLGNDIISGGGGNDTLIGNDDNDVLTGGDGDDKLLGGTGNDTLAGGNGTNTMDGGAGNDLYIVEASGDVVADASGTDTVQAEVSYSLALAATVENLTLIGTGNIDGTGNALVNTIYGNAGNNTLDGSAGADTLIGGKGDDTYWIDSVSDSVTEAGAEGTDTLIAKVSGVTLGANIEVGKLDDAAGAGASLTGNGWLYANSKGSKLTGGAYQDVLVSGKGADTFIGGGDIDTVSYEAAAVGLKASLTTPGSNTGEATGDSYSSIEGLIGSKFDDTLEGTAGTDFLWGGEGKDALIGGAGADMAAYSTATAGVTASLTNQADNKGEAEGDTYSSIENLRGSDFNDVLIGSMTTAALIQGWIGDDKLDGANYGSGIVDNLQGGVGNDTYILRNYDTIVENAGQGTDTVDIEFGGYAWTAASNLEILTIGAGVNAGAMTANATGMVMIGNELANTLIGGAGDDTLIGGDGTDALYGGTGTYDVASYETATSGLTVNAGNTALSTGDAKGDVYTSIEGIVGSSFNDTLVASSTIVVLDGGKGADTLIGSAGNDVFIVDDAGDLIQDALGGTADRVNSFVDYTLGAGIERLWLQSGLKGSGNGLANFITGSAGNDTLDGGVDAANDTLTGGLGDDTYIIRTLGDVINEGAGEGTDTAIVAVSGWINTINVEIAQVDDSLANATLTGYASASNTLIASTLGSTLIGGNIGDVLQGNDGNDVIYGAAASATTGNDNLSGGKGDDYLYAGMGADVIDGGEGIDTAAYWNSAAAVTVNLKTNVNTGGEAQGDKLSNIEVVQGTAFNDSLTGDDGDNTLIGFEGNDVIIGGAGKDLLIGGNGNDSYAVKDTDDVVTELAGEGIDIVYTDLSSYTLGANIENLSLSVTATGVGNDLANAIVGSQGDDILDGGADAAGDSLIGGAGDDTFLLRSFGDAVTETAGNGNDTIEIHFGGSAYAVANYVEIVKIAAGVAAGAVTGNAQGVTIFGNEFANTITGGAGADVIVGGAGADQLNGGLGVDYVSYATAVQQAGGGYDGVTVSFNNASLNTFDAAGDTYAGFEGLRGSDFNDVLMGSWAAAMTLDGGKGNDCLVGGTLSDAYVVDSQDDVLVESAGNGTDTVWTALDGYVLTAANVENLTGFGSAGLKLTGSSIANVITGTAANDTLDGGSDTIADSLIGGKGDDTYLIHTATDVVTENTSEGADTVIVDVTGYTVAANIELLKIADGASGITVTANAAGGTMIGNALDNVFNAGAGIDTYDGAAGKDFVSYGHSTALVSINLGAGIVSGGYATGDKLTNIENLMGSDYADTLTGDDNANVLGGITGNDVLDGGKGDDVLAGGTGDDTYVVDSVNDQVVELAGEGTTDIVYSTVNYALSNNVEKLTLSGTGNVSATGNTLANVITGNDGNNTLDGGNDALADSLVGGKGSDAYILNSANDIVTENAGEGTDTIEIRFTGSAYTAAANVETVKIADGVAAGTINAHVAGTKLVGNALANTLVGNTANDTLVGGAGADSLTGGAGTMDFASYETATSGITASLSNTALNTGDAAGDTYATIEGLWGSDFTDILWGAVGATNYLLGGKGNDILHGSTGNDTYWVDSQDDVIDEAGSGTDLIYAATSFIMNSTMSSIEFLTLNGAGNINGTGTDGIQTIDGNAGDNILDGGLESAAVVDTLIGGDGNDTYLLRNADTVTETSSGGIDTVQIQFGGAAYAVASYVENVVIAAGVNAGTITADATNAITMYGNELANWLVGNTQNDTLIGGAGADSLNGGAGTDTASYWTALAGVTADLTTSSNNTGDAAGDSYVLIENLTGSAYNDILCGNASDNLLYGYFGADQMAGGLGNDTYYVDEVGDVVIENAASGTDAVGSNLENYTLAANVENLTLFGTTSKGNGNSLNNTIYGNAADNVIDGGAGNDIMIGGLGNDTFTIDSATDAVIENLSEGSDTIIVNFASIAYTVANYVETAQIAAGVAAGAITASAQGTALYGNELANTLIGAAGIDILDGGAGADTFIGNGGSDWVSYRTASTGVVANMQSTVGSAGDAFNDTFDTIENLVGSAFNDTLTGDANANSIYGGAETDVLSGAAGSDTINGESGNDYLIGGAGSDTYLINRGEGTDTINNIHADALADTLQFGASIDETQLWFKRNGNDLEISIIGTTDGATVSGWYSNTQNQIANIKDASGHNLVAAKVEALVAAMAAFAAPSIGQTTLDTALQTHLQPVLAASWQ
jgi:Ca2+-binding RTX toxin-like protein